MRTILAFVLVLAMAASVVAAAEEEGKIFPYEYKRVTLDNGFNAYLIKAPGSGQIAYLTVVRTGARDEWEPGHSGFAHLFEHMMFRGTEKYPGPEYDRMLTRIGADRNANTSDDRTAYYLIAAADSLELVMDLESDRFKNLSYDEPTFKKETGAVLGEFYQGRANPFSVMYETLRDTAFDAHTYKHTTIGFEADVVAMPTMYDYSLGFFKRYYRPENCVLLIAGDFDPEAAEELIRKYYGDWEPGYIEPRITPEPPQDEPRSAEVKFRGRTLPVLTIAYKAPAWSATDKVAVATQILGQLAYGHTSDLYKRLVVNEQKVEDINAGFGLARDPSLLTIIARLKNAEDFDYVQQAVEETAAKFAAEPCDEKTLEDTKSNMKYGFLMRLETPQGIIFSMINFVVNTGGIEAVEDYFATVMSITPEDIRAAAGAFLVDNAKTVVKLTSE